MRCIQEYLERTDPCLMGEVTFCIVFGGDSRPCVQEEAMLYREIATLHDEVSSGFPALTTPFFLTKTQKMVCYFVKRWKISTFRLKKAKTLPFMNLIQFLYSKLDIKLEI